ncbi:hypothetical protein C5167_023446 [Papaver somniferum]|uniref:Uncharacterized protein n=1 Tax=Papaver somniferum TaxID=3469 RepID=A0A4Y7JP06_PAPSO|nr:hypothetical protein C5167_023446 [Papaver somniferum]
MMARVTSVKKVGAIRICFIMINWYKDLQPLDIVLHYYHEDLWRICNGSTEASIVLSYLSSTGKAQNLLIVDSLVRSLDGFTVGARGTVRVAPY